MRYVLALTAMISSLSAFAAEGPVMVSAAGSSQLTVSLTVADPCQNTRYATSDICAGKSAFRVIESTEVLQPVMIPASSSVSVEEVSPQLPYRVRVIDFY